MTEREAASPGLSGAGAGAVPAPAAAAPSGLAAPHLAPHFTPFGLQNTVRAGRGEPEPCGEGRQVCVTPLRAPALRPGHSGAGGQRGRAGGTDPGTAWAGGRRPRVSPSIPGARPAPSRTVLVGVASWVFTVKALAGRSFPGLFMYVRLSVQI